MMDFKVNIDPTPVLLELFKIDANIRTLVSVLLTDDQKKEFNEKYMENYKLVISQFIEDHPGSISDVDELKKSLAE